MWKFLLLTTSLLFSAAAFAQSPPAETQTVCGFKLGAALFAKWRETSQAGLLGCPLNSEGEATASLQGTRGRWALFDGSSRMEGGLLIMPTSGPKSGTVFIVRGCVGAVYQALGSSGGIFGFPLTEEYEIPGGIRADFEGGTVSYDAASGRCTPHPTAAKP
jgi:hypothetical protein